MILDLQKVAQAMRAQGEAPAISVTGWSVDTRTQNVGDAYFALRGPHFDGHDYVKDAWAKSASAVVVERVVDRRSGELVVGDSLRGLQNLAIWARRQWGGQVVGVTGSAGKTTTKDAIAQVLAADFPVGKTVGNFNNHVGVPLSILRLPGDCKVGVLEMGMNHAGEIRELAAIAGPQIGVVTNVGYAHVEFFESIEGVAAAKRELIEALPADGLAVLNGDDPRVLRFRDVHPGRSVTFGFSPAADVRAEAAQFRADGASFRVDGVDYETGLVGRHAVMNLLAALAIGREFGIAPAHMRDAIRSFTVGRMRGEKLEHNGILVWNDCYNSNPEAAQSMIDVLRESPAARRIAVLGEMLELGNEAEALHRQVGKYAAEHGVDMLIGVQGSARALIEAAVLAGLPGEAAHFFAEAGEAGDFVRQAAHAGDAILFKGSRGVHVERALERFLA